RHAAHTRASYDLIASLARHPLGACLVPYTTLFRSGDGAAASGGRLGAGLLVAGAVRRGARGVQSGFRRHRHPPGWTAGPGGVHVDRKSTRLNSSDVKISYAVFCLKKKKEHTDELES